MVGAVVCNRRSKPTLWTLTLEMMNMGLSHHRTHAFWESRVKEQDTSPPHYKYQDIT